ncbi:MAG: hypothetical protein AAB664_00590 [Patescibacteria group bacterium]
MKKITLSTLFIFFLLSVCIPLTALAATQEITDAASSTPKTIPTKKIKDTTLLSPAEAKAVTAKLNKEHNNKAFEKKLKAKQRIAATKQSKQLKKKIPVKKIIPKK